MGKRHVENGDELIMNNWGNRSKKRQFNNLGGMLHSDSASPRNIMFVFKMENDELLIRIPITIGNNDGKSLAVSPDQQVRKSVVDNT